jgi:formate dehydrogenase major subunit
MVPAKDGGANAGHACVKGRFAWGYATTRRPHHHADDPPEHDATLAEGQLGRGPGLCRRRVQAHPGQVRPDAVGGITSSRCTNEETYLVQKLVRAAFGNNNVDTCARVCHSPTGYGLKQTLGESAGTQDFASVLRPT